MRIVEITGFAVFPAVDELVFVGAVDSWDGGPVWNPESREWEEQTWDPDVPRILFPDQCPVAYVLIEGNRAVKSFQGPLFGLEIISQEDWNDEWWWCREEDLDSMVFFEA